MSTRPSRDHLAATGHLRPEHAAIVAGVYLYDLPDLDAYRHFSAVAHPQVDTDYFVAFTYDTGDRFEVRRVTASTAATVSSVSVLPSVNVVSLSICTTDDSDQPDGVVWAAYALEGGGTYLRAWRDPAFTTYWTQQPVSISPLEKLTLSTSTPTRPPWSCLETR